MYDERLVVPSDEALRGGAPRQRRTTLKSAAWSLAVIEAAATGRDRGETDRGIPRCRWGWAEGHHEGAPLGAKATIAQSVYIEHDHGEGEERRDGIAWLTGAVSVTGPEGLVEVLPIAAGLHESGSPADRAESSFSFQIAPPATGTYRVVWRISSAKDSRGRDIPRAEGNPTASKICAIEVW